MSTPKSRLASFRSYSYYHVLVMCDSSETAHALAESQLTGAWDHATSETAAIDPNIKTQDLGKYSPKCVGYTTGSEKDRVCKGRYCVLINGSTDAAFSITNAKWSSATAAGAVPQDGNTSLAVEGSISISEPRGVAFLDQVVRCAVALGVDNSQVVYCLKTFFVGFTDSDTQTEIPTVLTDIAPVVFTVYDVTGSFSETGGTYDMLFVAQANGVSRLPQYSKAVNSMNVTAGDNLAATFKKLQDNINASYELYYQCVESQLKAANTDEARSLLNSLCKVEYTITVDPPYDGPGYKVTNAPAQVKNTAGCDDPAPINFPANTSIETAINTIMKMCPQVQDEMSKGDKSTELKYEYKVYSCVKSERIQGDVSNTGKLKYSVVYHVARFLSPKATAMNSAFAKFASDAIDQEIATPTTEEMRKLKNNIIEFEYLYTGKNIDILEFDMKVNMGLAYLQIATLANTFKEQRDRASAIQTAPDQLGAQVAARGGRFPGGPVQVPVFFGKQITHPRLINTHDGLSTLQSGFTLAKHSSLEVSDVTMKIIGNDALLLATNKSTSPEYMLKRFAQTDASAQTSTQFDNWMYVPSYAKVKVKMPRNNDDFSLFTGKSTVDALGKSTAADYAQDFWFDGYYYIYGIDHEFDNGEFTQTLQMIGIPKTSTTDAAKVPPKDVSFDTQINDCFGSKVGCGKPQSNSTTSPAVASVPSTPPDNPTEPTGKSINQLDADTINSTSKFIDQVKGWDTAAPEVRTAIINAASQYVVDPVVLAQMCYQESKFDPHASNPHSSALGLFQFIEGSWDAGYLGGTDNNLTAAVFKDKSKRADPQLNAYAGAKFLKKNAKAIGSSNVGDLYLAHFLGAGNGEVNNGGSGALGVIKYDELTNGTMTLIELFGAKKAQAIANANKGYIFANWTVRDLRTWAAIRMAKTLKNSIIPVARNAAAPQPQATTPTPESPRKASDNVAAQQDCKSQADNSTKPTCTKKPMTEQEGSGGYQVSDSGGAHNIRENA